MDITVSFDFKRCLHVAECVRRAPKAFEKGRRPWILPDEAEVDVIMEAVLACPTGALRYKLPDGVRPEAAPVVNTCYPMEDGPLYVRGQIEIVDEQGEVLHRDKRAALCRCGQSGNKPFCDNSHKEAGFRAPGLAGSVVGRQADNRGGRLAITPERNGPFQVRGSLGILMAAGEAMASEGRVDLCRCGSSQNKPYCDGSHRRVEFRADSW